jgi:signal transduction histidine kinase
MQTHPPHLECRAPDSIPATRPFSLPEVRIAVWYVLLASLWIIGSDALLNSQFGGDSEGVFLQSFKGLNFVITTGILLYFVLRRAFGGWRRSEELRLTELRSSRERFRKLSSRIQTLREEERTRISREIHDELGQLLTGVKLKLRLIEDQLDRRDDRSLNPAIDHLVDASGLIDETIGSVRRISSGLRPLALDHLGLAAALDEEADQFTRRTGIQCQLRIGAMETPVAPSVETTAFRIFQESLTNVARHAKATRVEAECAAAGGMLTLRVRDDGVGIDPQAAGNPVSLGMVGMLERASDVGGRLEFHSSSGKGTEVLLRVPLSDEAKTPVALCS